MRIFLFFLFCASTVMAKTKVRVGSKVFTESYIIAEVISQKLELSSNVEVARHFGLGATGIALGALKNGEVDVYPEYTGTLAEIYLPQVENFSRTDLEKALNREGLTMSGSFGFNNTYGLALLRSVAEDRQIQSIQDLRHHPDLRLGLTQEFRRRKIGWRGLRLFYDLPIFQTFEMEHNLAYQALTANKIDVMEVYTTDAKIEALDLKVLNDEKNYFPKYEAIMLARKDFVEKNPHLWQSLKSLENTISETKMIHLNSLIDIKKKSFQEAAQEVTGSPSQNPRPLVPGQQLWAFTLQHLYLVIVPILLAILVGVPLGFMSEKYPLLGRLSLLASSVIQTIPSLALLCFLIPVVGIGSTAALSALFLYSLLPILLGTIHGLQSIDPHLREITRALDLQGWFKIRVIEFPLALPSVLVGIKTSLIQAIGTATIAALIGAGGYGNLIVTGLAINDLSLVLQGAVPSAILALLAQGLFLVFERLFISKGLEYGSAQKF